tara:strand:- start:54 stop:1973 length:1920 start_codon:yes stop_codon:yes gene_type:complete
MANLNKQSLKQVFSAGNIPTEADFASLIDSQINNNDTGSINDSGSVAIIAPASGFINLSGSHPFFGTIAEGDNVSLHGGFNVASIHSGSYIKSPGSFNILLDNDNSSTKSTFTIFKDTGIPDASVSPGVVLFSISESGQFFLNGNITASGNISSSGTIVGSNIATTNASQLTALTSSVVTLLNKNVATTSSIVALTASANLQSSQIAALTSSMFQATQSILALTSSAVSTTASIVLQGSQIAASTGSGNLIITTVSATTVSASGTIVAEQITSADDIFAADKITAGGAISSSAGLIGETLTIGGASIVSRDGTTIRFGASSDITKVHIGKAGVNESIDLIGNVTASSHVSASGFVFGDRIYTGPIIFGTAPNSDKIRIGYDSNLQFLEYGKNATTSHFFKGPVTASGNISASGTIVGSNIATTNASQLTSLTSSVVALTASANLQSSQLTSLTSSMIAATSSITSIKNADIATTSSIIALTSSIALTQGRLNKLTIKNITATDETLTAAESGKLCLFSDADGAIVTLPDSGDGSLVGVYYDFYISVAATSNGHRINVADTTNEDIEGYLHTLDADSATAQATAAWKALNSDGFDAILMDGTTTGTIGTAFRITNIAADRWYVTGHIVATGTPATPFVAS